MGFTWWSEWRRHGRIDQQSQWDRQTSNRQSFPLSEPNFYRSREIPIFSAVSVLSQVTRLLRQRLETIVDGPVAEGTAFPFFNWTVLQMS
jgi:hypothetical protein